MFTASTPGTRSSDFPNVRRAERTAHAFDVEGVAACRLAGAVSRYLVLCQSFGVSNGVGKGSPRMQTERALPRPIEASRTPFRKMGTDYPLKRPSAVRQLNLNDFRIGELRFLGGMAAETGHETVRVMPFSQRYEMADRQFIAATE